jgi:hypothetical protein
MPRPCTVCSHAARSEIDAALVTQTHRAVAKQFQIGESAVYRHKIGCLVSAMAKTSKFVPTRGETIAEAPEVMEVARADRLVDHVEALRGRAMRFLDELEALAADPGDGEGETVRRGMDYKAAALMLKEARECLGLQARLLGEMQSGANARIHTHPAWIGLRDALVAEFAGEPPILERFVRVMQADRK